MTPNTTARNQSLFMAMELSNKNWKLGFSNGEKIRLVNVVAGHLNGMQSAIARSKEKREHSRIVSGKEGKKALAGVLFLWQSSDSR